MLVSMWDASDAFTSFVRITMEGSADAPGRDWARPGDVTDASDATLRELRRRAVDPVVAGLLQPGELDELTVHWGEAGLPGDVWVRLVARGEAFTQLLSSSDWEGEQRAGAESGRSARGLDLRDHLRLGPAEDRPVHLSRVSGPKRRRGDLTRAHAARPAHLASAATSWWAVRVARWNPPCLLRVASAG